MSAVVAGLIGTVVGVGVKWFVDFLTERQRHGREDRVWRRDRYVEAAADLLALSTQIVSVNQRIGIAIYSLSNAENRRDDAAPAVVAHYEERLKILDEELTPLLAPSNQAYQIIRLYGPREVAEKAADLRQLSNQTPEVRERQQHWTELQELQTEFVDLVRSST